MVVVNLHSQLDYLKRAAQIHIQTALLRFAVQRRCAMNDGISSVDQAIVVISRQSKALFRQVAAKNADTRLQVLVKRFEIEMQLKCAPEAVFSFMGITCAYQQVQ